MILKEENYLYVDLQPLFAKAAQLDTAKKTGEAPAEQSDETATTDLPTDKEQGSTHKAWGNRLVSRLAENRQLGQSKKPEDEIIQAFFKEYFNNVWGGAAGEQLIKIGALLRDDIQKLGWDKATNPILAFIAQQYVTENLLATKLLNGNTYKALHNALAKKLVGHSEFMGTRNYNLIYCRSFYNRLPADMIKYLEIQAKEKFLPASATKYTIEAQQRNRVAFLALKNNTGNTAEERAAFQIKFGNDLKTIPHMLVAEAKLLDLDTVEAISQKFGNSATKKDNDPAKAAADDAAVASLVKQLAGKPALQQALMQQLAFTASEASIKNINAFLSQDKFSRISAGDVFEASLALRKVVNSVKFDDSAISALIAGFNNNGKTQQ